MKLGGIFTSWVGGLIGALALVILGLIGWVVIAPPTPDETAPATVAAVPDAPDAVGETAPEADVADDADSEDAATPEADDAEEAEADAVPEAEADADAGVQPDALPTIVPGFDVVRIRPDGSALVAGRAEPGASVSVLVDGDEVAAADSDAGANFVAMFNLPPLASDRVMSLEARLADGTVLRSETSVIVEGVAMAPDVVALGEPAADTPAPAAPDAGTENLAAGEIEEPQAIAPEADASETVVPETDARETVPVAEAPETEAAEAEAADRVAADTAASESPALDGSEPDAAAPDTAAPDAEPQLAAPAAPTEPAAPEVPRIAAIDEAPEAGAPPEAPESSQAPTPLAPGIEPPAPRILLAGPDGLQVLQDPGPNPQLSLDAIGYDQAGDVALAGRGSGEALLRIYLNNTPVGTARVEAGGQWRAPLPDVAAGVYTLRVDSIAPDGSVSSRIETPFMREEPEVLAALDEQAAAAAAAGQPISAVTVQPGHTLWAIARGRYGQGMQYWTIFDANRDQIRDPDWIYPGQVFTLPETTE
jgi:nucleoid-associated protein YgaU